LQFVCRTIEAKLDQFNGGVPSVFTYFRLLRDERLARSFSFRLLPTPKS